MSRCFLQPPTCFCWHTRPCFSGTAVFQHPKPIFLTHSPPDSRRLLIKTLQDLCLSNRQRQVSAPPPYSFRLRQEEPGPLVPSISQESRPHPWAPPLRPASPNRHRLSSPIHKLHQECWLRHLIRSTYTAGCQINGPYQDLLSPPRKNRLRLRVSAPPRICRLCQNVDTCGSAQPVGPAMRGKVDSAKNVGLARTISSAKTRRPRQEIEDGKAC